MDLDKEDTSSIWESTEQESSSVLESTPTVTKIQEMAPMLFQHSTCVVKGVQTHLTRSMRAKVIKNQQRRVDEAFQRTMSVPECDTIWDESLDENDLEDVQCSRVLTQHDHFNEVVLLQVQHEDRESKIREVAIDPSLPTVYTHASPARFVVSKHDFCAFCCSCAGDLLRICGLGTVSF